RTPQLPSADHRKSSNWGGLWTRPKPLGLKSGRCLIIPTKGFHGAGCRGCSTRFDGSACRLCLGGRRNCNAASLKNKFSTASCEIPGCSGESANMEACGWLRKEHSEAIRRKL